MISWHTTFFIMLSSRASWSIIWKSIRDQPDFFIAIMLAMHNANSIKLVVNVTHVFTFVLTGVNWFSVMVNDSSMTTFILRLTSLYVTKVDTSLKSDLFKIFPVFSRVSFKVFGLNLSPFHSTWSRLSVSIFKTASLSFWTVLPSFKRKPKQFGYNELNFYLVGPNGRWIMNKNYTFIVANWEVVVILK